MPAITNRLDIELEAKTPTAIDQLGATATLLSAEQLAIRYKGSIGHKRRVVIRFEKPGEAPQDVTFGPDKQVATVYGYQMAVFGGTVLSIFPPGQPPMP